MRGQWTLNNLGELGFLQVRGSGAVRLSACVGRPAVDPQHRPVVEGASPFEPGQVG